MRTRHAAFTLVELLVVIGIISLLVAILLPTLNVAMQKSRLVQCASNERQICLAIFNYVSDNRNHFPVNTSTPTSSWDDVTVIGVYIKPTVAGLVGGAAYTCPNDPDARVSYSMNIWASSKVDSSVTGAVPSRGTLWTVGHASPSKLLLVAEAYSGSGNKTTGWYTSPTIGFANASPGKKFGGGSGLSPPLAAGRFALVTSELCYMRHRSNNSPGHYTQPIGRLNIAYGDGHVESKTEQNLVNVTGNSSGDTLWSPSDVVGP